MVASCGRKVSNHCHRMGDPLDHSPAVAKSNRIGAPSPESSREFESSGPRWYLKLLLLEREPYQDIRCLHAKPHVLDVPNRTFHSDYIPPHKICSNGKQSTDDETGGIPNTATP